MWDYCKSHCPCFYLLHSHGCGRNMTCLCVMSFTKVPESALFVVATKAAAASYHSRAYLQFLSKQGERPTDNSRASTRLVGHRNCVPLVFGLLIFTTLIRSACACGFFATMLRLAHTRCAFFFASDVKTEVSSLSSGRCVCSYVCGYTTQCVCWFFFNVFIYFFLD